jgi:hypothetical protein
MQRFYLLLMLGSLYGAFSCSPRYTKYISAYSHKDSTSSPDYSKLEYWAAHPGKPDPSDSVPRFLEKYTVKDSVVDVFFLHPTTLTAKEDTNWNADINNPALNAKTDYSTILYQASVFNECRVFAPRYRQAHIRAYYTSDTSRARNAFALAYQDIRNAFQYYLDHFNKGRPIIIAAHSQGSTHAQRLLKEFFESGPLKTKLVVAYIPGMYIPGDYFTTLKMCTDSMQTGCIVGWRTYKSGYEPAFVQNEKNSGWVTNPLTWTSNENPAPYRLNKGGVINNFNKLWPNITDARIHDGILWIDRPHITGSFLLRMKNFHIGDINLFYMNIRANVRQRISAFWKT